MSEDQKGYFELIISVPDESSEALTHKLMEVGSMGFFEKNDHLIAYFEDSVDITGLRSELERFREVLMSSGLNPEFSYEYTLLPEQDWNEEWKKSFTPIDAGENLTIIPSWLKPENDRLTLIIDPGRAFGTGHHETTKRCLELIERLSGSQGGSVLDIGTGTGVLAIGASMMGFGPVTGIDIDPLAVELAGRNVEYNYLENVVVKEGDVTTVSGSFDLIVANLISEVLIDIANHIVSRLNPGGIAILSGMINGQEEKVIQSMELAGGSLMEQYNDDKWVTLYFKG